MFSRKRGQVLLEHILVIGIVIAALFAMYTYMKRGIQGVIKVASDQIGSQADAEETDPQKGTKAASDILTITEGTERRQVFEGGRTKVDIERVSVSSGTATYISERENEKGTDDS